MAVSSTSVKGFRYYKSLVGVDMPNTLNFLIENSTTLTIGDAVRLDTNGAIKRCASTDPAVLGILAGLYDQTGQVSVFSPRIPSTAIAGATLTPDDTIQTASDNRTNGVKKLQAAVFLDVSGDILFWNQANNATLAQANIGQLYGLVSGNSGQIDTTTNSNSAGLFQLVSLDPDGDGDASKGLFRIVNQQFPTNYSNANSTTVITA